MHQNRTLFYNTKHCVNIFCDVICLHLIMNCDPLILSKTKCSKYWKNKITLSSPAILSPISQIMRIWRGFENSKFYSVNMSSLSVLPPSLAASFEYLYNLKVYKAYKQHN